MATTRDPDPEGEMTLVDYFHESSGGHYDTSRTVKLTPGSHKTVVMDVSASSTDQFKGPSHESQTRWKIGCDELIALVMKHGQQIG